MVDDAKLKPPSAWVPITNLVDLKHLGKLGEELGEAQAAVSRCIIQGVDGREPVTNKLNKEWLEDEIADVMANMRLVSNRFKLDVRRITERAKKKEKHLRVWHSMEHMYPGICAHSYMELQQHQGGKVTCGICGVEMFQKDHLWMEKEKP